MMMEVCYGLNTIMSYGVAEDGENRGAEKEIKIKENCFHGTFSFLHGSCIVSL